MLNSFIEDCLDGIALLDDIDAYVKKWHSEVIDISLEEFIGLTEYESEKWLQEGDIVLRGVIYCRRHDISYSSYEEMSSNSKIAARSYDGKKIQEFKNEK